jgi:hypothetical protein
VKIGLIVILVLVGGAFLLVRNGDISFYAYSVSRDPHGRSQVHCFAGCKTQAKAAASGAASSMLQDALLLVAMDQSQTYNHDFGGLLGVLSRASHMPRPSGAALVWRKAPAFVRAMDHEESLLFDRVRAVDLHASGSELCRQVALRYVARTQGAVRDFEIALAQSSPTWATVKQFNTARIEVVKSYLSELRPCIAAVPSRDRKQLADTMLRF